jgi:putative flippase GtrA
VTGSALGRLARARFTAFLAVGTLGFVIDAGLFIAARLVLPDVAARLAALAIAITATWWLNRRLTFRSEDPHRLHEWARYVATSLAGAATNATLSLSVLWFFPRIPTVLALAFGSLTALGVNFVLARRLAYRAASSLPHLPSPYSSAKVEGTCRVPAGGS